MVPQRVLHAPELHFLWVWTVVNAGIWMGWTRWAGWNMGFFLISESILTEGRSWFRLMICSASWVLPMWQFTVFKCIFYRWGSSIIFYASSKVLTTVHQACIPWSSWHLESCATGSPKIGTLWHYGSSLLWSSTHWAFWLDFHKDRPEHHIILILGAAVA